MLSRLLRFMLREEIDPRISTSRNFSYAMSGLLHYVLVFAGFLVGLATLAFFAGAGGLGEQIFSDITFKSNVVVAGGLAVVLAALLDALILLVQRAITPWTRVVAAR